MPMARSHNNKQCNESSATYLGGQVGVVLVGGQGEDVLGHTDSSRSRGGTPPNDAPCTTTANAATDATTTGDAGQTDATPLLDNIRTLKGGQVPIEEEMVVPAASAGAALLGRRWLHHPMTTGGEDGRDDAGGQGFGQRGGMVGSIVRIGSTALGDALHDGVVGRAGGGVHRRGNGRRGVLEGR